MSSPSFVYCGTLGGACSASRAALSNTRAIKSLAFMACAPLSFILRTSPFRRLHIPTVLMQDDGHDLAGRVALEGQSGGDDVVVEPVLANAEHGISRLPG